MKARLADLKEERETLAAGAAGPDPAALDVLLHPQLAEGYRRRIDRLDRLLDGPDQDEAREVVRSMIDRVVLTRRADGRGMDATLHGALATLVRPRGRFVSVVEVHARAIRRPGSRE
jgi:site-specific DNA recombinase